jgi:DNA replication and repair protein RecF
MTPHESGDGAGSAASRSTTILCRLTARNFRNFERLDVQFEDSGAVLVGENGQGKTNLLEAIAYLQLLRSVRGVRDADLVRFGAEGFHVGAEFARDGDRTAGVGFEKSNRAKRVRLDGVVPERLSDALGALPSVMFSPGDVELIAGSPASRRRYMDIVLALTAPHAGYLAALQRYRAALARRNAAMREAARGGHGTGSVAVWEPALAESGAVLVTERVRWVRTMAPRFSDLCAAIGEHGVATLGYQTSLKVEDVASVDHVRDALREALDDRRGSDIRRGLTHTGPHRDDLAITICEPGPSAAPRELRIFGSAGQQRTAAIVLRLLEAETFRDRLHLVPVMLLDDPFAELDVRRSARILELLRGTALGQTILAVPRASDIPTELSALPRMRVASGCVESERAHAGAA